MSVRQVGKKWRADVCLKGPDGVVRRKKKTNCRTRKEAQAFERDVRQKIMDGRCDRKEVKKCPTLVEFAADFVKNYAEVENRPSEIRMKRSILKNHLVPAFGDKRLSEIRAKEIAAYKKAKLDQGLSRKYVNNHLTVLRKLLVVAKQWELIDTVPTFDWLKAPKPDFDFLDFSELERVLEAAEPEWHTMMLLASRTGMRKGELLALRWDDCDLVAGKLNVRRSDWRGHVGTPKNGRTREIPLASVTLKALKDLRHLKGKLVFTPDGGDGRAFTENELRNPLWRACKRAGLRKIGWHVFRHTFASHLAMRGVPLKVVQEYLGHSTIEMTMRYSHLSPDVGRAAVELLDEPFNGPLAAHGEPPTVKLLKRHPE